MQDDKNEYIFQVQFILQFILSALSKQFIQKA